MTIKIQRGGLSSRVWSGRGWDPKLRLSAYHPESITLDFKIDSGGRGGGTTEVLVSIDGESFEHIAQTMIQANPKAASRAFAAALQAHAAEPAT